MDMPCGLDVHRKGGGAGIAKGLDGALGVLDHQVDVEGQLRIAPAMLNGPRPDGDRRDEVAIHDIEVDPVGTRLLELRDLLTQPAEVGREERRGDQH